MSGYDDETDLVMPTGALRAANHAGASILASVFSASPFGRPTVRRRSLFRNIRNSNIIQVPIRIATRA